MRTEDFSITLPADLLAKAQQLADSRAALVIVWRGLAPIIGGGF
jgi:hypothetical protein